MAPDDPPDEPTTGTDYRQVSFVVLAAVAVVVAAFFAPAIGGQGESEFGEPVDESDDAFDWLELLALLDLFTEPEPAQAQCTIWLSDEPVPGTEVTATVHYEDEELADAPVWFNDRHVGQTDEQGQVTGTVPYERELLIRVGAGEDGECRAGQTTASRSPTVTDVDVPHPIVSSTPDTTSSVDDVSSVDFGSLHTADTARAQIEGNATAEYEIDGFVMLDLQDDPYPGEEVTVEASIQGVPMRSADVAVDGESIGETDDDGTVDLTIPDDGSDRLSLTVARGEFERTATLRILLLEAQFVADGIAPIPGSDGAVQAEIADEPVEDADVAVDGEPHGETDENGTVPLSLPLDPTEPVTVDTGDQTATTTFVDSYGGPLVALTVLVFGGVAAGYRTHGSRGSIAVLAGVAAVMAVLIAEAFYGTIGGLVTLVTVAVIALALAAHRSDRRVRPSLPSAPSVRGGITDWVVARTLAIVAALESLLAWLRSLVTAVRLRIASLPRSVTGLARALGRWLAALPGRAVEATRRAIAATPRPGVRTVVAVAAGATLVAASYVEFGERVAAVVATVFVCLAVVYRFVGRDGADSSEAADAPSEAGPIRSEADTADDRTFREIWRAFARDVAPRRWRTRTPGEIRRRALEEGYPREPVAELTTLFLEVEYGDRARSETVRRRGADAYDEIVDARAAEVSTERDDGDAAAVDTTSPESASLEGDERGGQRVIES
ncbi:DUF4129 domain-containing protein [Natrialba swarupiae]|uniref:DUF4129 domain-containing protein n=1 Tax=Natrialba swarupiae TaxID=2448032 RepID=A0A5D5AM19_9EURY|nr:DUF4129 domain-containing protein [Natrialba swarupiae]TYT61917.1 DUF4129 domain-containing protein [Natrialba swarupiae]